jgi:chemotaxis protein CheD
MPGNNMSSATLTKLKDRSPVGIGQVALAAEPVFLTTILGSCIAVALYSPRLRLGMLSHVLLPRSTGPTAYPAKFADTAVPHMISVLQSHGVKAEGLVAKIAGGACMFGNCKSMQIGESNIQVALAALADAGIRVAGQHVGGSLGRRVAFDLSTGNLTVECIGQPAHTI